MAGVLSKRRKRKLDIRDDCPLAKRLAAVPARRLAELANLRFDTDVAVELKGNSDHTSQTASLTGEEFQRNKMRRDKTSGNPDQVGLPITDDGEQVTCNQVFSTLGVSSQRKTTGAHTTAGNAVQMEHLSTGTDCTGQPAHQHLWRGTLAGYSRKTTATETHTGNAVHSRLPISDHIAEAAHHRVCSTTGTGSSGYTSEADTSNGNTVHFLPTIVDDTRQAAFGHIGNRKGTGFTREMKREDTLTGNLGEPITDHARQAACCHHVCRKTGPLYTRRQMRVDKNAGKNRHVDKHTSRSRGKEVEPVAFCMDPEYMVHSSQQDSTALVQNNPKQPSKGSIDKCQRKVEEDLQALEDENNADAQADLIEIWSHGRWTGKQKKAVVDLLNSRYSAKLPSVNKIQGTPHDLKTEEFGTGKYIYFGLEKGIRARLDADKSYASTITKIELIFNVDGLPYFNNGSNQVWALLAAMEGFSPITVAIFAGDTKPEDLEPYIKPLLEELKELEKTGIVMEDGRVITINVLCWVCDAPAHAWLKNIKGHTGYFFCEKCTMKGFRHSNHPCHDRVSFANSQPRTDEAFQDLQYFDEDSLKCHQHGTTPLITYGVPCVSGFVLDFMHCVCLGCMKRLLTYWLSSKFKTECFSPLAESAKAMLEEILADLGKCYPSDFTRQEQRGTSKVKYWKAKELRNFLFYIGPAVLQILFSEQPEIYQHFLYFHAAIRALCIPEKETRELLAPWTRQWLLYFVDKSIDIYGKAFPCPNIHFLCHLTDDVLNIGKSLDELSAFQFENHLGKLKKLIQPTTRNACVSAAKGLHSQDILIRRDMSKHIGRIGTKNEHVNDNCFYTADGDLVYITEKNTDGTFKCDLYKEEDLKALYEKPINSKDLYISVIDSNTDFIEVQNLPCSQLKRKAVLLEIPDNSDRFVATGVLHTLDI